MLADLLVKMREEDKLEFLLEARRYIIAVKYVCEESLSNEEKLKLIEAKNSITYVLNNLLERS